MPVATPPSLHDSDQRFRWTRAQYEGMIREGILTTDHAVELLGGEITQQMAQSEQHAVATGLVSDGLRSIVGSESHIRDSKPIALSGDSEPTPDVVIVRGVRRTYLEGPSASRDGRRPTTYRTPTANDVLLLVEVSDRTLTKDRVVKAPLYARAGILEYWVVNLIHRVLHVYRDPAGGTYRTETTYEPGDAVAPLAASDSGIPVGDLLP